MDNLTNDQKIVLTSLYKHFLERQPGLDPLCANYFVNSDYVQELLTPQFSKDYVSDICWDLHRLNYLCCIEGDDLANDIKLQNPTIVYMENTFTRTVSNVVKALLELKGLC